MGKDLKGKELGVGLRQTKDGKYHARLQTKDGRRPDPGFDKLSDAKRWLIDTRHANEHNVYNSKRITVNQWFEYWIDNYKKGTVTDGTIISYRRRYRNSIDPVIGFMQLNQVKPIHCKEVLNKMVQAGNQPGTIQLARTILGMVMKNAMENDYIPKNPVISSVRPPKDPKEESRVLTIEEQERFMQFVSHVSYGNVFRFALETGMRRGELLGLTWDSLNCMHREIYVTKQILVDANTSEMYLGAPKSKKSNRMIPMSREAERILKEQNIRWKELQLQGNIPKGEKPKYVFFSETGKPVYYQTLYHQIKKICVLADIDPITIHTLRHTFATRCIERGMKPKVLQKILGHANLSITMDLYVHVTEDLIKEELFRIEESR